ncbi:MAG: hypothetical protein M3003_01120 [Candidatus Dormibacteraeota bacterium]|nr:hypothetical protein [Candidatus Dormibacteraeota bacterium]
MEQTKSAEEDVTVIDSLQLAFEVFQCCRHDTGKPGPRRDRLASMLDLFAHTLEAVDRTGELEVQVPP